MLNKITPKFCFLSFLLQRELQTYENIMFYQLKIDFFYTALKIKFSSQACVTIPPGDPTCLVSVGICTQMHIPTCVHTHLHITKNKSVSFKYANI